MMQVCAKLRNVGIVEALERSQTAVPSSINFFSVIDTKELEDLRAVNASDKRNVGQH
jgi:hypothetical protein